MIEEIKDLDNQEASENSRREFLLGLNKWSKAAIGLLLFGAATSMDNAAKAKTVKNPSASVGGGKCKCKLMQSQLEALSKTLQQDRQQAEAFVKNPKNLLNKYQLQLTQPQINMVTDAVNDMLKGRPYKLKIDRVLAHPSAKCKCPSKPK